MLASSIGASLVVNAVTPEHRNPLAVRSWDKVLDGVADRASEVARGSGEQGLVEWFERHARLRPVPRLTLLDGRGHVLAGRPLTPDELRALSDDNVRARAVPGLRQAEFEHDRRRYHIVSHGFSPANRLSHLALVVFRPPLFWLSLLIAVLLSVILSFGIARYLVRPLRSIERAAQRLSEGDLSARVGPALGNRGDEIADFAAAFDQMATRVESLVRAHKVLLRDVSHELRSPLARAHAALSLARQQTKGMVDNELDRLEVEIERLDGMIGKLLTFSRLDSEERQIKSEPVELVGLLSEIAEDSRFEASSDGKTVRLRDSPPLTVNGDLELLASGFENVIRNAVRHTHADTAVEITVSYDNDLRQFCRVEVRDHGDGVPDAQLEQIFEPFYRVEEGASPGSGRSGIGLAIAKRAVGRHGGEIVAANAPGGGLVVSVTLPVGRYTI